MALVEEIQKQLRALLPTEVPGIAKGVIQSPGTGWFKVLYYDPVTGARVTFTQPPTIVAIAELREGTPPKVTAPTISIPTVEMPAASTISIPLMSLPSIPPISVPAVELPKTPTIEIPVVTIPFINESFPYFVALVEWIKPLVESLNAQTRSLYTLQSGANDVIHAINQGLKKARDAVVAVRDSLFDFRDKVQAALNDYRDKIQAAVNSGFSDSRTKTQEALNAYRDRIQASVNSGLADSRDKTQTALNTSHDNIQASVNAGLNAMIPKLYEMIGMPIGQLMSPINIRNVTAESFEFYALSAGMRLHYIAIGKR